MKKMNRFVKWHMLYSAVLSFLLGMLVVFYFEKDISLSDYLQNPENIMIYLLLSTIIGVFCIFPYFVTLSNIYFLFSKRKEELFYQESRRMNILTLGAGTPMMILAVMISTFRSYLTSITIGKVFFYTFYALVALAWLVLCMGIQYKEERSAAPFSSVIYIALIYIATGISACYCIPLLSQAVFFDDQPIVNLMNLDLLQCVFILNCILLAIKTIKHFLYRQLEQSAPSPEVASGGRIKRFWFRYSRNSKNWPWLALMCVLPVFWLIIPFIVKGDEAPC